jgi:hypothetical protein
VWLLLSPCSFCAAVLLCVAAAAAVLSVAALPPALCSAQGRDGML